MNQKTALLIVDLQNDFCSGGALAVPGAEDIIPLINQLHPKFDVVVATKDWHPSNHVSFHELWPVHCVQGTKGAEFHAGLDVKGVHKVIHKGQHKAVDSYSAFYDNEHLHATGLSDYLHEQQVGVVYVVGLATDYCVKYSAMDAVREGFEVYVVADACRGVELKPGDVERAFTEMKSVGVKIINSNSLVSLSRQRR